MSKHRLFYSKTCRFCQAFLEELSTTAFVPLFQLICVDKNAMGQRPPLPPWLKSVPTLVVAGEAEPRVGPGAVNNWLFEAKLGVSPTTTSKTPQNVYDDRNTPLTPPVYSPDLAPRPSAVAKSSASESSAASKDKGSDDPAAYYGSEMAAGKWSDNFSFIGDTFTAEKGMNPIERNFQSLLAPGTFGGGVQQTSVPQPKRSAKEDALLQEFEAYSAKRDMDVKGPPARR